MIAQRTLDMSGKVIAALFRCARYALFFVMMTLRPLIVFAGRGVATLALLCGLAYGVLRGWSDTPCRVLLGTSLAITIVTFVYDLILARLGPDGLDLYS